MSKLDNPIDLYHVQLSRLPVGWKVSLERDGGRTKLKIHTSNWGVYECAFCSSYNGITQGYGEVDKGEKTIKAYIRSVCQDRPFTFSYEDFRKHYPSDRVIVAAYSRFEPGEMFADCLWLNRSQQEKLVVALLCEGAFRSRVAAKISHKSLDVFVGSSIDQAENQGGGSPVVGRVFRRDSSEGISFAFIAWPNGADDQAMLLKDAGPISRVAAALIDGLVPSP